ncbi:unnamed protein product, partial [Debaryomyces fabryi]
MAHWTISIVPLKALAVYVILQVASYLRFGNGGFQFSIVGLPTLYVFFMYRFFSLDATFREIIEEIIIPEFIEKRPFKQLSMKRKETLDEMIINVNNKVNYMMGTNYGYTSAAGMVRDYKRIMTKFEKKYHDIYKGAPAQEIQGWDKMLLVAKNIQDEDLGCVYENSVSLEIMNKYGKTTTNEYELDNIG